MSFQDLSPKKIAIIMVAAGIILVFAISGFQARNLFASSVTEEAKVSIKNQNGVCIVEGSDGVPREIVNCSFDVGDTLLITYKPKFPSLEKYELKN